jgi:hypothetical protein
MFDFVIAFMGPAVGPAHACTFVSDMVQAVAVNNPAESSSAFPPSIWVAFQRAIRAAPVILESSPLVAIFKEHGEPPEQRATCRQVVLHTPLFTAWGMQFKGCGAGCKNILASDMMFYIDDCVIHCHCKLCGWKSWRLKHEDVVNMVPLLSLDLAFVSAPC